MCVFHRTKLISGSRWDPANLSENIRLKNNLPSKGHKAKLKKSSKTSFFESSYNGFTKHRSLLWYLFAHFRIILRKSWKIKPKWHPRWLIAFYESTSSFKVELYNMDKYEGLSMISSFQYVRFIFRGLLILEIKRIHSKIRRSERRMEAIDLLGKQSQRMK